MSSTPLTATVQLQSCVRKAYSSIEVSCRGIYVICFDIIRYMNSSFTPLTLTIGYAHDNNFNSLSMLSLQQNITGIDFSELKTKVLEWERLVFIFVFTSCIAAFLQLLGGSVHKNVILTHPDCSVITSLFCVFIIHYRYG